MNCPSFRGTLPSPVQTRLARPTLGQPPRRPGRREQGALEEWAEGEAQIGEGLPADLSHGSEPLLPGFDEVFSALHRTLGLGLVAEAKAKRSPGDIRVSPGRQFLLVGRVERLQRRHPLRPRAG